MSNTDELYYAVILLDNDKQPIVSIAIFDTVEAAAAWIKTPKEILMNMEIVPLKKSTFMKLDKPEETKPINRKLNPKLN